MSAENPLDELESLMKERPKKRVSYLMVFLESIPNIRDKAIEWFDFEANIVKKEIELLEEIMPEETIEWRKELDNAKKKFHGASKSLDEITERARKGEISSIREVYKRPLAPSLLPPEIKEEEEEKTLDVAGSLLNIMDAAEDLEELINKVELEARRTLRLRRLVRIELKTSRR